MADEEKAAIEAATTETPPAEVTPPVGQTISELKAQIAGLEAKYSREIGDRDRGMARQAESLKGLRAELSEALSDLAKRTFGEGDAEPETEYQQFQKKHLNPKTESSPSPNPVYTVEHAQASGQMMAIAEQYGVDTAKPPAELGSLVNEVTTLFADSPQEAAKRWKAGLKKRDDEIKSQAEAEAKAKQAEATRKAKQGQRDTSLPTGGGGGTYEAIRDAWMKNPNDPATINAYLEARRARGV